MIWFVWLATGAIDTTQGSSAGVRCPMTGSAANDRAIWSVMSTRSTLLRNVVRAAGAEQPSAATAVMTANAPIIWVTGT